MKIIKSLSEVGSNEKIALTIGNFDGVHRGHQKLFKTLNEICGKKNLKSAVITFLPHPKRILFPDNIFFMINSYAERRELISELNIDYLVELDFTRDFSTLKPGEFIDHYIIAPHCVKEFYIGYDFVFGANKKGGYDILSEVCKKNNICMTVQEEFLFQGNTVSSSTIRQKIATGKLDVVSDLLGRNFFLSGIIIKGEGRGRQIGFPTANMELTEDRLIPEKGVYITKTSIGNMVYESVTNVGEKPTFVDTKEITVETHIFDFDKDIYGESIKVAFIDKIRDEKKLDSGFISLIVLTTSSRDSST